MIDAKSSWDFFAQAGFDGSWIDGGASRTWYLAFAAGKFPVVSSLDFSSAFPAFSPLLSRDQKVLIMASALGGALEAD